VTLAAVAAGGWGVSPAAFGVVRYSNDRPPSMRPDDAGFEAPESFELRIISM